MSNAKKAMWLAVVALVLAAGVAKAGVEKDVVNSGPQNWADLVKGRISFKEFLAKEAKREPGAKCADGYEWVTRGDEGPACWAKPGHGASVTCQVLRYERRTDENGTYDVPVLGQCTSSWGGTGGFAGNGPAKPDTQSP